MRPTLVCIAVALLLALPVLGDPGSHSNDDDSDKSAASHGHRGGFDGLNETQMQEGLAKGEKHGLFARLAYTPATGLGLGKYVSFNLNATTGIVGSYAAIDGQTRTFFDSIVPTSFAAADDVRVTGSLLRLNGTGADLAIHNNPTAALSWHGDAPLSIRFELASTAAISENDTQSVKILVDGGLMHGHIVTTGAAPLQIVGLNVTVTLAAGESVVFRAHPGKGGDNLHDELAALKSHKLGFIMRIADAGGVAASDATEFDVRAVAKAIRKGHVDLEIDSDQHEGRVLFVTVDGETLDPTRLANLVAHLNGTLLPRVDSIAAVNAASGGAVAFVKSADGLSVVVVVRVSHFSSYALALSQLPASSGATSASATGTGQTDGAHAGTTNSTQGAAGLGLAALVGLFALVAVARRRSE